MNTTRIITGQPNVMVLALVAITGWISGARAVAAEDAAADSRQKAVTALKLARQEYLNGLYVEDEKRVRGDIFVAEQTQKTAEQGLKQATVLVAKGVITALQLDSAVQAAANAGVLVAESRAKLKSLQESKAQILEQFDQLERALLEGKAK